MDMETMLSFPWRIMMPEFTILGVATLLTIMDLLMKNKSSRKVLGWIALGGVALAIYFVIVNMATLNPEEPVQHILFDMYRLDGFSLAFKLLFLVGTGFVFLLSLDYVNRKDIAYEGEFYYLLLTAVLGAMMLASSSDMITMFVGLELLSLSSYIMVGLRKKSLQSNESAFKYVVSGGIATAIMLYGMSFIYGLSGTTNLFEIGANLQLAFNEGYDFMIYFAFFLTFIGMAFKISVVPFHMWAPDVYQGAPTPITAFLSVVSKAAGFALILRFFLVTFLPVQFPELILFKLGLYIALIAAASMIIGNTLALRQTNVKRLFAFSSIAQAGYILVPLASLSHIYYIAYNQILNTMFFYLVAYLLMNIGAFAIIQSVTKQVGTEDIKAFAGLYHRSPFKALAMTIFLLSLAGLPVTAGFMAKFMIFMDSITQGMIWLAIVMVVTSVISYFYYFGIIRQMYLRPGDSEAPLKIAPGIRTVITLCLVGTVIVGIIPSELLEAIANLRFDTIFMPGR